MAASEAQHKLEELHSTINADLEKTRRELNEMETLLRQTTTEVEKLAQRELGWQPAVALEEGLSSTVDYFRQRVAPSPA